MVRTLLTPAIALAAGADEVIAVSRDSAFGSVTENLAAAASAAALFDSTDRLTCVNGRPDSEHVRRADIITNLGFIRPIDAALIADAKPTAAVPLMCEAWEWARRRRGPGGLPQKGNTCASDERGCASGRCVFVLRATRRTHPVRCWVRGLQMRDRYL